MGNVNALSAWGCRQIRESPEESCKNNKKFKNHGLLGKIKGSRGLSQGQRLVKDI